MGNRKTTILIFVLLVVVSAIFRVWDSRPPGFAPQIAMALFAGAVIRDKRLSFLVPLVSMLLSDLLYQFLYQQGLRQIPGFYSGQFINYILFAFVTVIGFFIQSRKISSIFIGSVAGVVFFFLLSNFLNWMGGGLDINNQPYPKTFNGLMTCYAAAIPFLKNSLWATLAFSSLFFGSFYLYQRYVLKLQPAN